MVVALVASVDEAAASASAASRCSAARRSFGDLVWETCGHLLQHVRSRIDVCTANGESIVGRDAWQKITRR